jgi:hypothetical protein
VVSLSLSPRLGDLQDVSCLSLRPPFVSTWFCGSDLGRLARGAWDLTWALLLQAIRAFRVRVSWFAFFSRGHYCAESHLLSCLPSSGFRELLSSSSVLSKVMNSPIFLSWIPCIPGIFWCFLNFF